MAQRIKLEIDPESYEDVKGKLVALYEIAEEASLFIEKAVQQSMKFTTLLRWLIVSIFINVVLLAIALYAIIGN